MTVPYSFGTATSAIPLSQLDSNFNTPITLGNTAIQLGNTVTTLNNMTLANVTITSGTANVTANVSYANANAVVFSNSSNIGSTSTSLTWDGTTLAASNISTAGSVTLSGGTANGVLYLNGSKVATSGSALTFDGTTLGSTGGVKVTGPAASFAVDGGTLDYSSSVTRLVAGRAGGNYGEFQLHVAGASGITKRFVAYYDTTFQWLGSDGTSEQMRLTSTGLGIGTSSPTSKLTIGTGTYSAAASGTTGMYSTAGGLVVLSDSINFASRTGGDKLTLDSSGNLGLGVTPSAWGTYTRALQMGDYAALNSDTANGAANVSMNAYYNGTNWIYRNSSWPASYYSQINGQHRWLTAASGTAGNAITFTQALTLDADGNLIAGKTSTAIGTAGVVVTYYGTLQSSTATGDYSIFNKTTTSTGKQMEFRSANTSVGDITCSSTATTYNTSSDYRLKEDILPMTGALAFVRKQRPVTYKWKADGSEGAGYIAHWMQEDGAGNCVTGTKDAVDADGKPVYQGIDTSFMVAPLNAAINELADIVEAQAAIIEQLKADVAALKGA